MFESDVTKGDRAASEVTRERVELETGLLCGCCVTTTTEKVTTVTVSVPQRTWEVRELADLLCAGYEDLHLAANS